MEELAQHYFTFERWRNGCLTDLGIYTRHDSIIANRHIISQYAIGYCFADKLWVRAKENCVAIMFWFNQLHFWTHFTVSEFEQILKLSNTKSIVE
jgi:hypothetical protein